MAASASDKLLEVGIASATTLDANYTINDTSITVASTSGWPTATGVAFAMDVVDGDGVQVPGSYNEYIGVVSSGTSITSVDHMNGTDRNYSAGATTRVYVPVSAERENRIVEWGLVHADQDGTLKAGAVDVAAVLATDVVETAKIKDLNVTTAKIADAAVTPAKLLAGTGTSWVWQDWTPTLTGITQGTGTVVAKYTQIGKTVIGFFDFTFGASGSAMSTGIVSLPITASSNYTVTKAILGSTLFDDAGTGYGGFTRFESTTTIRPVVLNAAGTYLATAGVSSTVPFTWASGDKLHMGFIYEAA